MRKKSPGRAHPPWSELTGAGQPPGDVLVAEARLVSRECGVVRAFDQMAKGITQPRLPYTFRAELANHRFHPKPHPESRVATGKGMTLDAARASTLGEAVERYSAACWEPGEVTYARRDQLPAPSLDPRQLVLYAPWQYEELPYAPYSESTPLGWVTARSLVSDTDVLVPAMAVFMGYHPVDRHEVLFPDTSNGLGAGATLAQAVISAACEVFERDAFLITWMNRLPARCIDPCTHPDAEVVQLVESYHRRGVQLRLYRLPTDHPCSVFMAVGTQEWGAGPAAMVGLGADLHDPDAARKAVLEFAQIHPGLRATLAKPEKQARLEELVADPHRVTDLDDHDLLYADSRMIGAFDFLLRRPVEPFDWGAATSRPAPAEVLTRIADHFRAAGGDVLWSNLTPADMAGLGLHTVRAIVAGFQPMHFGWKEPRLGGTRLYELPYRLGLTSAPTTPESINDDPHPLA